MIKAIFLAIAAGVFSTSLFTTVDFIIKKQGVQSHWTDKIDGKSKATKPKV